MPVQLTPIEKPAADVLLTGDPRRAFALAGDLMVQPRMSHQARGLWGYTGTTPDGLDLTVQSTGTGGPGAAAVLEDLLSLDVRRVIRLGACVAPPDGPAPGAALLVSRAVCRDGVSSNIAGPGQSVLPDPDLFGLLDGVAGRVVVSSHDFVARFDPDGGMPDPEAAVRDLQTATVLGLAAREGIPAAGLLVVASAIDQNGLTEGELTQSFLGAARETVRRLETAAG